MGFFDSVQSSLNRGMAGASRTASTVRLKGQMSEALKRRQALAAQLGASLYELTRDNPEFRAGREALYDGIAAIDQERAQYQAEIDRIEAETQAAQTAASYYTCPFCGAQVGAADLFCAGCGKPIAEIKEALAAQQAPAPVPPAPAWDGPVCPACGAPVNVGDAFCMNCGHKFGEAGEAAPVAAEPAATEPAVEPEPVAEPAAAPEPAPAAETVEAPEPMTVEPVTVELVAQEPATPEPVATPAEVPAPAPEGKVCPSCGTVNRDKDKFCMACGTKL